MAAPQPCRPRSTALPELMEELVEEILRRIPPDEPAHLVRAALVCKAWRRIILSDSDSDSDQGFLRRYRAFHRRRPPLLGFFFNETRKPCILRPSFMPVVSPFPSHLPTHLHYRPRVWCVLDCRHGRVLLEVLRWGARRTDLIVWDPVSHDWHELQPHGMGYCGCYVVLCAAPGCDHLECRCGGGGGPFFVVCLRTQLSNHTTIRACVYSSEARAWGTPVSSRLDTECDFNDYHVAVIGDEIYIAGVIGARILKYDLVKRCFSSFISPSKCGVLMPNEDGSLGIASVRDSKLYLWSRMVNNRAAEWVQRRVIELDKMLPIDKPCAAQASVTGFAEGVGILFISNSVGTFTFQLESGRVRKIRSAEFSTSIYPFVSFFHSM